VATKPQAEAAPSPGAPGELPASGIQPQAPPRRAGRPGEAGAPAAGDVRRPPWPRPRGQHERRGITPRHDVSLRNTALAVTVASQVSLRSGLYLGEALGPGHHWQSRATRKDFHLRASRSNGAEYGRRHWRAAEYSRCEGRCGLIVPWFYAAKFDAELESALKAIMMLHFTQA
jgi:hypothetical protein